MAQVAANPRGASRGLALVGAVGGITLAGGTRAFESDKAEDYRAPGTIGAVKSDEVERCQTTGDV